MQQLYEPSVKTPTVLRWAGWSMLFLVVTYLVNNWLQTERGWQGVAGFFGGAVDTTTWFQTAIYACGFIVAAIYVSSTSRRTLRADAQRISNFNAYLIRACFWAVLFVGLADMMISFLRVEGLLAPLFGEDMFKKLSRPVFRGQFVHIPLIVLGAVVALFTRTLGFPWLAIMIVIAELLIVFTRFIFSYEQAFMADLVRFWYAALFLFASAYTLLEDGHVRVDVFYAGLARRTRGAVNSIGSIFLGMSLCWVIIVIGFKGRTSIIYGPVASFEVSQSGFGMYTKYLMAAFLGIFAISMLIQFICQFFDSCADYRNDAGGKEPTDEVAATN